MGPLNTLSQRGGGFDALYRGLFVRTGEGAATGLSTVDRELVDKGIGGGFTSAGLFARTVGFLQTGYVRAYALAMLLGLVALVLVVVLLGVLA